MVPGSFMGYIRDGKSLSAEASMMVRSNNCSDSLPGTEEVRTFIKEEKEKFGEMIARV